VDTHPQQTRLSTFLTNFDIFVEAFPAKLIPPLITKGFIACIIWEYIIHRDLGYLCFGLTIIYVISGVAVNHIQDWNPNYVIERQTDTIDLSGVDISDHLVFIHDLETTPPEAGYPLLIGDRSADNNGNNDNSKGESETYACQL
jgi:hypothetical protein